MTGAVGGLAIGCRVMAGRRGRCCTERTKQQSEHHLAGRASQAAESVLSGLIRIRVAVGLSSVRCTELSWPFVTKADRWHVLSLLAMLLGHHSQVERFCESSCIEEHLLVQEHGQSGC